MEHNCPNCGLDYKCHHDNGTKNQFEFCSKKCKIAFRNKMVQEELSDKIFPDKKWY